MTCANDILNDACTAADNALDRIDTATLFTVETAAKQTKSMICREEYAFFRFCGYSREDTINHLANLYNTSHDYLARICKETSR